MAFDFEVEPGVWFGDWLHKELEDGARFERDGDMYERTQRVAQRLQHDRRPESRMVVEVPWIMVFNAFTAPGQYIYISRRLLERCPTDETVAFIIAHEIAHHDLGHLNLRDVGFGLPVARYVGSAVALTILWKAQQRIMSPEWEIEADRRAIELCLAAGYDGRKCLRIFDIMEQYALDYSDLDGVYGPIELLERHLHAGALNEAVSRLHAWLHDRERGYYPIQERRRVAARYVDFASNQPWRTGQPG